MDELHNQPVSELSAETLPKNGSKQSFSKTYLSGRKEVGDRYMSDESLLYSRPLQSAATVQSISDVYCRSSELMGSDNHCSYMRILLAPAETGISCLSEGDCMTTETETEDNAQQSLDKYVSEV